MSEVIHYRPRRSEMLFHLCDGEMYCPIHSTTKAHFNAPTCAETQWRRPTDAEAAKGCVVCGRGKVKS